MHIHRLAADGRVFLTEHAKRRNPAAGKKPLTIIEITSVLEKGQITEGPTEDIEVETGGSSRWSGRETATSMSWWGCSSLKTTCW